MRVEPTKDGELVDSIVRRPDVFGAEFLPEASTYISDPRVTILVAWEGETPAGAFLFISGQFPDEAEVHVAFAPESRGEAVIAAVAAVKEWLRVNSPFKRIRARPPTGYLERMVERLGFRPDNDSYLLEV